MARGLQFLRIGTCVVAVTSISVATPGVYAQAVASASANASLGIAPALSIRTSGDLVLATILLRAVPRAQGVARSGAQGISLADASFLVQGEPDQVVSMAISPGIMMAANDSPSLLFVRTIPIDAGAQLDANGRLAFRVRGMLDMNQATIPGQYNGPMTATAQYN